MPAQETLPDQEVLRVVSLMQEYTKKIGDFVDYSKKTDNPFRVKVTQEAVRQSFIKEFVRNCQRLSETASEMIEPRYSQASEVLKLELKLRLVEFEFALDQLRYWLRYYQESGF